MFGSLMNLMGQGPSQSIYSLLGGLLGGDSLGSPEQRGVSTNPGPPIMDNMYPSLGMPSFGMGYNPRSAWGGSPWGGGGMLGALMGGMGYSPPVQYGGGSPWGQEIPGYLGGGGGGRGSAAPPPDWGGRKSFTAPTSKPLQPTSIDRNVGGRPRQTPSFSGRGMTSRPQQAPNFVRTLTGMAKGRPQQPSFSNRNAGSRGAWR